MNDQLTKIFNTLATGQFNWSGNSDRNFMPKDTREWLKYLGDILMRAPGVCEEVRALGALFRGLALYERDVEHGPMLRGDFTLEECMAMWRLESFCSTQKIADDVRRRVGHKEVPSWLQGINHRFGWPAQQPV